MQISPRMTVAQLAEFWGVSRQHVYNLIEAGKLPVVRIGNLIRIRPEDWQEYERRQWEGREQNSPHSPSPAEAAASMSSGGKLAPRAGFLAGRKSLAKRAAS